MHILSLYDIPGIPGYVQFNLSSSSEDARKVYEHFTEHGVKAELSIYERHPVERNFE
jgi:hypothetical protein